WLTENQCRGGSDRNADERVDGHGQRQSQRLSNHLRALGFGVTREIGNVQSDGGPEADHSCKRRKEKRRKSEVLWNLLCVWSTGPKPPALRVTHKSSRIPTISMKGAPMPSRNLIVSIPRQITN